MLQQRVYETFTCVFYKVYVQTNVYIYIYVRNFRMCKSIAHRRHAAQWIVEDVKSCIARKSIDLHTSAQASPT